MPVPPPNPATMKATSLDSRQDLMSSSASSALCLATSAKPLVSSPKVMVVPTQIFLSASMSLIASMSVLMAILGIPFNCSFILLMVLLPAPPIPTITIRGCTMPPLMMSTISLLMLLLTDARVIVLLS